MTRLTFNKVNEVLAKHGYELVRGNGYLYYSPLTDDTPTITQEGLYGTTNLNAYTLEFLERELLERIEDSRMPDNPNPTFKILDNK